ncbi:MAG: hypothetical protein N2512_15250 [Armatimonadetes bacterium]|nr:hypothetical protein [Armatimonadota bacterium]
MGGGKACDDRLGDWRRVLCALLLAVVLVALWNAVFVVTGLVEQPPAPPKVARPPAMVLPQADTGWVNLDAWRRTHPSWTPQP